MKLFATILIAASLLAFGCQKKDKTEGAGTTSTPATAAAPATSAVASADDAIPTEEDFEDEAEQKVTAQNADDELDKLEKEITAD